MKVVFELDLLDDPTDVAVTVHCGSMEDYERAKKLYPADPESALEGESDGRRSPYFNTTAWTGAKGKVRLTLYPPRPALDFGAL
jgi:hypothetical protein